jgi:hypothetical protein
LSVKGAKERVFSLYKVSVTWKEFVSEFGITEKIKARIRHKYPNGYVEKNPGLIFLSKLETAASFVFC